MIDFESDSDYRCYDYGDKVCDRYTIIPARKYHRTMMNDDRSWPAVFCNEYPFAPNGFGQHGEVRNPGKHLGKKVTLSSLPKDVQKFAHGLFS